MVGAALRAFWQHRPERHGKWKTVHARFTCWLKAGVDGRSEFGRLCR
ncbi:transposase [Mesorhizobium sp. B2-4-19]|nr:transposase [Mesorhizobium sp. B2-4-19]